MNVQHAPHRPIWGKYAPLKGLKGLSGAYFMGGNEGFLVL